MHFEFLVEEPSMAAFLETLLPRLLGPDHSLRVVNFGGKQPLLESLPVQLVAYSRWMPNDHRLVVLVDEDRENCRALRQRVLDAARRAGLRTRDRKKGVVDWQVLPRVVIEELEAWFLGDVEALRAAFPGVPSSLGKRRGMRDPDAVAGGTWEALERVLQSAGHFRGGLEKIACARRVAAHMEPTRNRSRSFQVFVQGLQSALNGT